jgi:AraC-like DNA-binding protein
MIEYEQSAIFTLDRSGRKVPGVAWWDVCPTCGVSSPEPHDHRAVDLDRIMEELRRVRVEQTPAPTKPEPVGEHLSLKALAAHAGLSVRKLRSLIAATVNPIPHHRIGGRVLVKRADYDQWAAQHRRVGQDIDAKIEKMQKRGRKAAPARRRAT